MNAATLSHASGRDDSVEVLWEDAERVFCRLLQKDAEGHRPAFAPILAGAEHPTFESINRLARDTNSRNTRWRAAVAPSGTGVIRRANFDRLKGVSHAGRLATMGHLPPPSRTKSISRSVRLAITPRSAALSCPGAGPI